MTQTPPDRTDLLAALDQFGADADRWSTNGQTLGQAGQAAGGLTVDPLAFGPSAWLGLADQYQGVQQMITDLLGEGSAQFAAISSTLITARDTYRREEDENVHMMKGIW